jgi:hypothetical protein
MLRKFLSGLGLWRALVNIAMNLLVPCDLAEQLLGFLEDFMALIILYRFSSVTCCDVYLLPIKICCFKAYNITQNHIFASLLLSIHTEKFVEFY